MTTSTLNCYEQSRINNKSLPEEWRDQNTLSELSDFLQSNWENRSVFFDDNTISSRQQFLEITSHKSIRTNNYIGTIIFKGQQINIFPKVFKENSEDLNSENLTLPHLMKNLVQWLQYCNRIEYPFIKVSSQLEESNDLREFFITLYLHYLKHALGRGPFYRFEDEIEDLFVIKGKIDFKDYINKKIPYGLNHSFKCNYSEFKFDNILNRIIKYTCRGLVNNTKSNRNHKLIRQMLDKLNDVTDVRCTPSDCDGIRLSKLQSVYSVLLSMSKIFLLNQTTGFEIDTKESFCFLFPTELLFEGFVGGFISELLSNDAKVKLQASDQTLINNIHYDGQDYGRAFTMRHDIIIEHITFGVFLLDTKYKHMPRFKDSADIRLLITDSVKQSDLYQIVEYASLRNLDKAYLLYPMYRFEDEEPSDVVLERVSQSGQKIEIHIVRLPFIFEENQEITRENLSRTIKRIITN